MPETEVKHPGGCLCGAVRYEVSGPRRDLVVCHCSKCMKFHGHAPAYSSVDKNQLAITQDKGLKWFKSTTDESPDVSRGFCSECGSSIFWDVKSSSNISITAGSFDDASGLKLSSHIWLDQKFDYYEIDDELPKYRQGLDGEPI